MSVASPSTRSFWTRSSGAPKAVMPMLKRPGGAGSVSASQSASINVVPRGPATMSNQYQPPSMNGASDSVRSIVSASSDSTWIVSIGWLCPRAVERYRMTFDSPARRIRRVTSSTVVQRRQ